MASTITVKKGLIGATRLIQSTGGVTFGSDLTTNRSSLYSDSAIWLSTSNVVNGVVKAKNLTVTTNLPINIGSGANLKDSVVGKGNITIATLGSTVRQVFLPTGNTYSGPTPTITPGSAKVVQVDAALLTSYFPVLPSMPAKIPIDHVGTTNITAGGSITPGYYGDMQLSGSQALTFSGPGVYVFNSIKNSSSTNSFVFDFNNVKDNFIILVKGDVDIGKNVATATRVPSTITIDGLGSNYIFLETLGNFTMANGTVGGDYRWLGTVWAPNGNITLSNQGTKGTIQGACFTNNTINVTTNALIDYAPYINVSNADNPIIVPDYTPPMIGRDESIIGPQLTYLE
jgi:hypothetical protein